ncbi:MAG: hypothetical protein LC800_09530 [Acidobacteria bacterium]|nr:hypothetical protein [Acidobacteriota bacterium]
MRTFAARGRHSARRTWLIVSRSFAAGCAAGASCWGLRQLSRMPTFCAQATVQSGAQCFSVSYSRMMSAVV